MLVQPSWWKDTQPAALTGHPWLCRRPWNSNRPDVAVRETLHPFKATATESKLVSSAVAVAVVWLPGHCEICWLLGWTTAPLKHVLVLPTDIKPAAQLVLAQHSMLLDLTASCRRLELACVGSACRLPRERPKQQLSSFLPRAMVACSTSVRTVSLALLLSPDAPQQHCRLLAQHNL